MKKKCILFILLLVLFRVNLWAQPESSTKEAPIWYYIQVVGENDRANRVFTYDSSDEQVYGLPKHISLERPLIDTQLWRFERNGLMMDIINKASGKKLDVTYNSSLRLRVAAGSDEPSTKWRLYASGNYYNIRSTVEPEGGTSGTTYAFQAPSSAKLNYIIMFEAAEQRTNVNALFSFVKFNDNLPKKSTDDNDIWFFILSAKPGNEDKCITVVSNPTDPEVKCSIEPKDKNNENQYWKFVEVEDGSVKYHFVNKGTGKIISTDVVFDKYFYAQYTDQIVKSNGWSIIPIEDGQYEIKGITNDNIVRYLYANTTNERTANHTNNVKNTGFAWSFYWIEGGTTNIDEMNPDSGFYAYSENNKIVVIGADDYVIRNIYGIEFNKDSYLNTGIYLVTANGKTKKILVK